MTPVQITNINKRLFQKTKPLPGVKVIPAVTKRTTKGWIQAIHSYLVVNRQWTKGKLKVLENKKDSATKFISHN